MQLPAARQCHQAKIKVLGTLADAVRAYLFYFEVQTTIQIVGGIFWLFAAGDTTGVKFLTLRVEGRGDDCGVSALRVPRKHEDRSCYTIERVVGQQLMVSLTPLRLSGPIDTPVMT